MKKIILAMAVITAFLVSGCDSSSMGASTDMTATTETTTINVTENTGEVYIALGDAEININQDGECIVHVDENTTRPCTTDEQVEAEEVMSVTLGNMY